MINNTSGSNYGRGSVLKLKPESGPVFYINVSTLTWFNDREYDDYFTYAGPDRKIKENYITEIHGKKVRKSNLRSLGQETFGTDNRIDYEILQVISGKDQKVAFIESQKPSVLELQLIEKLESIRGMSISTGGLESEILESTNGVLDPGTDNVKVKRLSPNEYILQHSIKGLPNMRLLVHTSNDLIFSRIEEVEPIRIR